MSWLAVNESKRALRKDTDLLISTVQANQQIEMQGRMQRQQDRETEVARAAREVEARLRGQEGPKDAPTRNSKLPSNPRLDLATARSRADTTSESEASDRGEGGRVGEGRKKKGKSRRKRSTSRTPRGRTQGQDTMD